MLRYMQLVQEKRKDLKLLFVDWESVDKRSKVALKEGPTYYLHPDPAFVWKMKQAGEDVKPSRGTAILHKVSPEEDR